MPLHYTFYTQLQWSAQWYLFMPSDKYVVTKLYLSTNSLCYLKPLGVSHPHHIKFLDCRKILKFYKLLPRSSLMHYIINPRCISSASHTFAICKIAKLFTNRKFVVYVYKQSSNKTARSESRKKIPFRSQYKGLQFAHTQFLSFLQLLALKRNTNVRL